MKTRSWLQPYGSGTLYVKICVWKVQGPRSGDLARLPQMGRRIEVPQGGEPPPLPLGLNNDHESVVRGEDRDEMISLAFLMQP